MHAGCFTSISYLFLKVETKWLSILKNTRKLKYLLSCSNKYFSCAGNID